MATVFDGEWYHHANDGNRRGLPPKQCTALAHRQQQQQELPPQQPIGGTLGTHQTHHHHQVPVQILQTVPTAAPPIVDPLPLCLDANGTYLCTSYNPRCYIIQKVSVCANELIDRLARLSLSGFCLRYLKAPEGMQCFFFDATAR
uniref:Uncharacterized protein n=1 Tax=Anopheles maculatus TaxID=74869 RepID=A0A182TAI2_9DIPT